MKRTACIALFAALSLGLVVALAAAQEAARTAESYKLDAAHAGVVFKIRHLGKAWVFGRFNEFDAQVVMEGNEARSFAMTIEAASIDTNNKRRDDHLRSGDFFNVEKFPKITFRSTRVERSGEGYNVTGEVTLLGVTRPITLAVEQADPTTDQRGVSRGGFTSEFTVKRSDFGMNYGPTTIGNEVHLTVSFEVVK